MICPNCKKPYFFIDNQDRKMSLCLRCKHKELFSQPKYDSYHEDLYVQKKYIRTQKTDPQLRFILKTLNIQPHEFVLDIGCGVGDYTTAISSFTKNVIGIDLNVDSATKKYPNVHFQSHNCNNPFPFADASVDVLISINLIEHLENPTLFLSECKRILKPNGRIALTTANLDFILHNYFYDKTHLYEWTLPQFKEIVSEFFNLEIAQKSSSMFNYYPLNFITTKFLKPDLLFIGKKHE